MDLADDPRRTFGFRVWHLRQAWSRQLETALAPLELTSMQYIVLRASNRLACLGERPSQARVAEALALDRMLVSKVVRPLERKGLVVRPVHPEDARAVEIVLTEAGRRMLAAALVIALDVQDSFFGRLGPERLAQFGRMLDDLLAADECAPVEDLIVTAATGDPR